MDNKKSRWYHDSALLLRAPLRRNLQLPPPPPPRTREGDLPSPCVPRSEWCGRRSAPDPVSPSPPEAQLVCDLCCRHPCLSRSVCNKLKKDALTVSHSEPQPRPLWSLKCSHGLPHSGSWGGGTIPAARWPCVRPPAQRPGAGNRRSERVPRSRVGSAPYSRRGYRCLAGSRRCLGAERCTAAAIADDAVPAADDTAPAAGCDTPASNNCDVLPCPVPENAPPDERGTTTQLPLRVGGGGLEVAAVAAAVPGAEASRLLRLSVVP